MRHSRRWALIGWLCLSCPVLTQADALKTIAGRLAKGVAELPGHRVAVLPFQYPDGGMSSGSMLVSDRIMSCLTGRRNVQVVERTLLSRLLEEMRLEISGVTPTTVLQSWGKILAVDGVITGTLVDLGGGRTEVHARLMQLDTGRVIAAQTATITRTWTDQPVVPELTPLWLPPFSVREQTVPAAMALPDIDDLIRDPILPPQILRTARQVYDESADPRLRAGALYAMGIILERRGLPSEAALAYRRLIDEFPENGRLKSDATGRLWATRQSLD